MSARDGAVWRCLGILVRAGGQKPADVMKRARKSCAGPLMVGKDLLRIDIGKDSVAIAK